MSSDRMVIRLVEVANGVIDQVGRFYPYRDVYMSTTVTTVSPQSSSMRFYIRRSKMSVRTVAGDTTTVVYGYGKWNNQTTGYHYLYTIPNVAQLINDEKDVCLLMDRGQPLTLTWDNAPTAAIIHMQVAEVDNI